MKFKRWIFARLRERSTWAGAVSVLTAAGVSLKPDQADAIIAAGVAVAGAVFALTKDDKNGD